MLDLQKERVGPVAPLELVKLSSVSSRTVPWNDNVLLGVPKGQHQARRHDAGQGDRDRAQDGILCE
jgi:hypothetical protein